jgi:hypothetical protein
MGGDFIEVETSRTAHEGVTEVYETRRAPARARPAKYAARKVPGADPQPLERTDSLLSTDFTSSTLRAICTARITSAGFSTIPLSTTAPF